MRNRAKCKLCGDIIESLHTTDLVVCKCGAISIEGGQDHFMASATGWEHFLRVDDEGNELIVKVVDKNEVFPSIMVPDVANKSETITHADKLEMLNIMCKNIENLPQRAMDLPINHYDFYSALLLIHSILKDK